MTGDQVYALRRRLQLSQFDFARLFGLHPQTISNAERGISQIPPFQAHLMEMAAKRGRRISLDPDEDVTEALVRLIA